MADDSAEDEVLPEKAPLKRRVKSPLTVVGVGASAGGLEALRSFFASMPGNTGIAFIVAQHLAPQHESLMSQLLDKHTKVSVNEARHGELIKPNKVYIAPPNTDVRIAKGKIALSPPKLQIGPKPSVDLLFHSIAEECKDSCYGVILSGTGSDGARGVQAIKAAGGYVLAQDAASAKYSGMPEAAQHTRCVDFVGDPNRIAAEIRGLGERRDKFSGLRKTSVLESAIDRIFAAVQYSTGVNFSDYKRGTLLRRIEARIIATKSESIENYSKLVEDDSTECNRLRKSILISVTSFFRDIEAFDALKAAMPKMLEERRSGTPLRVWVAGCATGEEAYTMAMILSETAPDVRYQIFATDIDEDAINIARLGVYPEIALQDVDDQTRTKYFEDVGNGFRIKRHIRESIVFAEHNLIENPPFLNLDCITCRNVLIYFQQKSQARVFAQFHQSLRPHGLLLLGKSESVGATDDPLFTELERRNRLFQPKTESMAGLRSRPAAAAKSAKFGSSAWTASPERARSRSAPPADRPGALTELLQTRFLPPSVLVDWELRIVETFGETGRFLAVGPGRPDFTLPSLVPEKLKLALRAEFFRARREKTTVSSGYVEIDGPGGASVRVRVRVEPLHSDDDDAESSQIYLISFFEKEGTAADPKFVDDSEMRPATADNRHLAALEDELRTTKEHLQTLVEELETSNEELQSLNEELQSSNEEMQASNEELHASNEELEASNEELQSTNEELITVNNELEQKSTDLIDIIDDLENIQNNVRDPLVVVDKSLCIRRLNRAMGELFGLSVQDVGAAIRPSTWSVSLGDLPQLTRYVIAGGEMQERVVTIKGRHYAVRIYPYIAEDRKVDGAVILFNDVTDSSEARWDLIKSEEMLKSALSSATEANRAKSEFLSNMSHELRTPLNAIVGFSDIMISEIFGPINNDRYRGYASDIHASAMHLSEILKGLLDLSRVEAGKLEVSVATFDPRKVADTSIKMLEPEISAKSITLRRHYSKAVRFLSVDETMFRQILTNLIGNAVKFTKPERAIDVRLKTDRWGAILLVVEDEGFGMTEEEIEVAKEPFGQGKRDHQLPNRGLGLGLPLVFQLAKLNDGEVKIDSSPGKGTTVSVRFAPIRSVAS